MPGRRPEVNENMCLKGEPGVRGIRKEPKSR